MRSRLGLAALLAAANLAAASAAAQGAAVPNFAGSWKLNTELSDKVFATVLAKPAAEPQAEPKAEEKKDPAATDDKSKAQPASPVSAVVTVRHSEAEIVAQEEGGSSRSFWPNGRSYKADEGTANVRSEWRAGALVYEKKSDRGWKYTETWRLTPEGRLVIETRIEGGGQKKGSTRRIYDRVAAQ